MERTLFRTADYLHTRTDREIFMNYFVNLAKSSGLTVLEYDVDHIRMLGDRWSFLKYYSRGIKESVRHGSKLSNELKRTISVLFWR